MIKYSQTPIQYANVRDLLKRKAWPIKVKFNYLPIQGQKYGKYRKLKEHVEFTCALLRALADNELYKIQSGITLGIVPPFFAAIVDEFYKAKKNDTIITEISIGNGAKFPDLWEYDDNATFISSLPKKGA